MSFNKYRTKGAYHIEWYETEDWYKYLIDRAVKFCNGSTLDVGCGDGVLIKMISEKGHITMGIDPDPDATKLAVKYAKNSGVLNIEAKDALKPGWEYDYLSCINVIEHMNDPGTIRELIRQKITKGAIITTIDYQGGELGEDHKFEWTYDEMMEFFKEFNPKGFRYKDTEWIGMEIRK